MPLNFAQYSDRTRIGSRIGGAECKKKTRRVSASNKTVEQSNSIPTLPLRWKYFFHDTFAAIWTFSYSFEGYRKWTSWPLSWSGGASSISPRPSIPGKNSLGILNSKNKLLIQRKLRKMKKFWIKKNWNKHRKWMTICLTKEWATWNKKPQWKQKKASQRQVHFRWGEKQRYRTAFTSVSQFMDSTQIGNSLSAHQSNGSTITNFLQRNKRPQLWKVYWKTRLRKRLKNQFRPHPARELPQWQLQLCLGKQDSETWEILVSWIVSCRLSGRFRTLSLGYFDLLRNFRNNHW